MAKGGVLMLLDSMMEKCRIMNHVRLDDDYGGYTDTWTEGASFDATIIKNSTTEAQIAEKQGVSELFTVVVKKGFTLSFHDVFKRVSDGQIFRVTSNVKDSEAPEASSVKIAKVTAEKWVLPA
jgi:hypothetical protein